jgi:hypothetical protein
MAPRAAQGAALEKGGRTDAGTVMRRIALDIEYKAFQAVPPPQSKLFYSGKCSRISFHLIINHYNTFVYIKIHFYKP